MGIFAQVRIHSFLLALALIAMGSPVLSGCSLKQKDEMSSDSAKVSLVIEGTNRVSGQVSGLLNGQNGIMGPFNPASLSDFDCFMVNVTGPGIVPSQPLPGIVSPGESCTYPGVMSKIVPNAPGEQLIDLNVPIGADRVFQVIGLKLKDGVSACPIDPPFGSFQDSVFQASREVGRTITAISDDQVVDVHVSPVAQWIPPICGAGDMQVSSSSISSMMSSSMMSSSMMSSVISSSSSVASTSSSSASSMVGGPISLIYNGSYGTTASLSGASITMESLNNFAFDVIGGDGSGIHYDNSSCGGILSSIIFDSLQPGSISGYANISGTCQFDIVSNSLAYTLTVFVTALPSGSSSSASSAGSSAASLSASNLLPASTFRFYDDNVSTQGLDVNYMFDLSSPNGPTHYSGFGNFVRFGALSGPGNSNSWIMSGPSFAKNDFVSFSGAFVQVAVYSHIAAPYLPSSSTTGYYELRVAKPDQSPGASLPVQIESIGSSGILVTTTVNSSSGNIQQLLVDVHNNGVGYYRVEPFSTDSVTIRSDFGIYVTKSLNVASVPGAACPINGGDSPVALAPGSHCYFKVDIQYIGAFTSVNPMGMYNFFISRTDGSGNVLNQGVYQKTFSSGIPLTNTTAQMSNYDYFVPSKVMHSVGNKDIIVPISIINKHTTTAGYMPAVPVMSATYESTTVPIRMLGAPGAIGSATLIDPNFCFTSSLPSDTVCTVFLSIPDNLQALGGPSSLRSDNASGNLNITILDTLNGSLTRSVTALRSTALSDYDVYQTSYYSGPGIQHTLNFVRKLSDTAQTNLTIFNNNLSTNTMFSNLGTYTYKRMLFDGLNFGSIAFTSGPFLDGLYFVDSLGTPFIDSGTPYEIRENGIAITSPWSF